MLNENRNRIRDFCDQMDRSLDVIRRRIFWEQLPDEDQPDPKPTAPSPVDDREEAGAVAALRALGLTASESKRLVRGTTGTASERVAQALRNR